MTGTTEFKYPLRDHPYTARGDLLVTSVRIEHGPGHDEVHIWNRGGKAGTLTVKKGDGIEIARRLIGVE